MHRSPLFNKLELYIMGLLAGLRLGKFYAKPDQRTPLRAKALWESAKKYNVAMYEFRILNSPLDLYIAHFNGQTIVFRTLPYTGKTLPDVQSLKKHGIPLATSRNARNKSYYATLVHGQLVGVVRLDPGSIIGNGHLRVRTLVEIENKHWQRQGQYFHPIKVDESTTAQLKRQGLDWDSVPLAGQVISVGQEISRKSGGVTTDVTDMVHPENITLFRNVATILQRPLLAIDFEIEDISKSWHLYTSSGIAEIYDLPLIDLHTYPMHGQSRDVGGAIWMMTLKSLGAMDAK